MFYLEEKTLAVIGATLGVSDGRAGQLLQRAMARLASMRR